MNPPRPRVSPDKDSISRDPALDGVACLDPPGGEQLRARFSGNFEGHPVTWDATLRALGTAPRETGAERSPCHYIQVSETGTEGILRLEIGLAVACVDLATLRNTIVMIRQYKRLRRGRHRW